MFEVVLMVDGFDVWLGWLGSYMNGGYVLYLGCMLMIEGFCKSCDEVVVFCFVVVFDSYVVNLRYGDVVNVGVIGVVLFV